MLGLLWKSSEKGRNWNRKSLKNVPRKLEKSTLKAKKSMPGGGLGAPWGDLGKKNGQEAVLADFGRFGTGAGCLKNGKMAELGAKMGPRWRQDDPRWGLAGHLEATWGLILAVLGGLGSDLQKNGRSVKTNNAPWFWLHFGDLGGLVGGSWGVFWAISGISWALLGDLGVKLGSSWQDVVRKLAEDGLRWPT